MLIAGADSTEKIHAILTDAEGRLVIVMTGAESSIRKYGQLETPDMTSIWVPTEGKKWVVTDLVVCGTEGAEVSFIDGDEREPWLTIRLLAGTSVPISFRTPIVSHTADNELNVSTSAATVNITVSGYEI